MSASTGTGEYERLLATCRDLDPVRTAVVDPCQKPALIGADGVIEHVAPLPNTTEEGARRRFLIRPSDYTFVEQEATRLNRELLGFYHSHPDHPARPSQYDLDHAFPFFWYVIVSIQQAQPEKMTVWRLADDRSQFREGVLEDA